MDNGIQFAEQPWNRDRVTFRKLRFDLICEENVIAYRLTKPSHPCTNGQVKRMKWTIKDGKADQELIRRINSPLNMKRYRYQSYDQLRSHLSHFLDTYNLACRLKTLSALSPYEYICKYWTSDPDRFIINPIHQMPGLNT